MMDDRTKSAFDYASDSVKQLITLATGIVTLTITFSKDVVGTSPTLRLKLLLLVAWTIYVISICSGVAALLCLTGELEPERPANPLPSASIWRGNIRFCVQTQIACFLLATILILIFGGLSLFH
ncbi:MAG: hypothetical protein ABSH08_04290 [Tepidisphaeraceae bacterium]|jgi:hypothetical protein